MKNNITLSIKTENTKTSIGNATHSFINLKNFRLDLLKE